MENFHLKAKTRKITGKKVKQLRGNNEIPAILYGTGVEPTLLTLDRLQFNSLYSEAGGSSLIKLDIEGNKEPVNVLLHQVDRNPLSDDIIHTDLLQVKLNEKIETEIPLILIGSEDAPVVKEKEGTIVLNRDNLEVSAFPQDLISEIEIDVSQLADFDQTLYAKDIKVPSTIEITTDPEEVIVLIQEPRSEEELAELDEEVTEDVEAVEVEEKGKKDEEGEEGSEESSEPAKTE